MRNIPFLHHKDFIELDEIDSTNSYLKGLLSKNKPMSEMVILAHSQNQGRGQYGNVWQTEPKMNLTFSYLRYPIQLEPDKQFNLNIQISLAIYRTLTRIIEEINPNHILKIKWPNDIFLDKFKIGGILIENSILGKFIESSIIGVGINVNQIEFGELSAKASSLKKILDRNFEIKELFNLIIDEFGFIFNSMTNLEDEYCKNLLGFNQIRSYIEKDEIFEGIIKGIDNFGRLKIEIQKTMELKTYWFKEIEFVI